MPQTISLDKKSIKNNALMMTLLRGCVSSYILSAFHELSFPVTLDEILNEYGQSEIEIFYQDKRTIQSLLESSNIQEFNTMNELLEETLSCIEDIVFSKDFDIETVFS